MKNYCILLVVALFINSDLFAQQKPNVLFIAIDDLNDWVQCLGGHSQARTPHIDRLASEGILFTNAHCQAPLCGPSRASVLSGMYPFNSGNYFQVADNNIKKSNEVTANLEFLPDYFEQFGYKTMGVGKIYHNGDNAKTFDQYGGKFDVYGPKPKKRLHYDPSWFPDKKGYTHTDWGAFPEHDSMMPDYKSANWAMSRLKDRHEKPFFLAVGFYRPHVPWHVPQKWFDLFPVNEIKTPPYQPADFDDIPDMGKRVCNAPMMPVTDWLIETNQWRDVVQAYLACIAFVDAQIGRVLDALENSEYANNTIVVLWSDHGYHLGEKNRFAKVSLWERSTRIPLIFKIPGIKPDLRCSAPVQLIDIYPTLVDLCGLEPYQLAEGHSLVPLIRNPEINWPYKAFSVHGEGNIAVSDYQYRLIQYEDKSLEFYDLEKDPNEWNNLANQPEYREKIDELRKKIPSNWSPCSEYNIVGGLNEYFKNRYPDK
jgi:arylsulfatase A-like enzyme